MTVLDGIRRYVGGDVEVVYEEGCSLVDLEQENVEAAVAAARNADVAIVMVGGNELTTKENDEAGGNDVDRSYHPDLCEEARLGRCGRSATASAERHRSSLG